MLIDTHFHLDLMENMYPLIREFRTTDVGIIAVGTTPKAYKRERQFCIGVENIRVGLGMHPQLIAEREYETDLFQKLISGSRYIGEIGLDFNNDYITYKDQQISCFRKMIKACADEGGKVLSIHSVKAAGTVIDELKNAEVFHDNICIFHWFTGTTSERKRAIENGAWFSINSKMLKTKSGQEAIKSIPNDRILLETDAPFTMTIESSNRLRVELEKLIEGITVIKHEDMRSIIEDNSSKVWNN